MANGRLGFRKKSRGAIPNFLTAQRTSCHLRRTSLTKISGKQHSKIFGGYKLMKHRRLDTDATVIVLICSTHHTVKYCVLFCWRPLSLSGETVGWIALIALWFTWLASTSVSAGLLFIIYERHFAIFFKFVVKLASSYPDLSLLML